MKRYLWVTSFILLALATTITLAMAKTPPDWTYPYYWPKADMPMTSGFGVRTYPASVRAMMVPV